MYGRECSKTNITQVSSIYLSGDPSECYMYERCINEQVFVEKEHLYIPLDYNTNIILVLVKVKELVKMYIPVVQQQRVPVSSVSPMFCHLNSIYWYLQSITVL